MLYLLGALAGGIGIDWLFGDPPNKYHPVAWLGQLIGFFLPRLKGSSEKAKGTIFAISLFGPAGAFAYRAINTLDSMVGYRDDYFKDIGWMSARLDTAANYIPARLTAFLMVVSAKILGADWKNSLNILQRAHYKTFSPNAGYPMATMAGALRVRLEKIGHYTLGDNQEPVTIEKCRKAISIMKLTTLLFCIVVSVPVVSVLYLAGWWRVLLGIP